MSGKPASVAATRAGAPRVLVYVADPRQLEPGAAAEPPPPPPPPAPDALYLQDNGTQHLALPRNTVYRSQIEHNDQRNLPNTIFYKSLNDNDNKLSAFGSSDNDLVQRTDFFPGSQQFIKEATVKIDQNKVCESTTKSDVNQFRTEFGGVEGCRIATETADTSTYQTRCVGPISDSIMPPVQSPALRQGPIQFESNTVQSEGTNCSDRELPVGKSYVNYQFLEQSVSHQSIVNQSISILNQQVGVSRGVTSEGDSGAGPQLVRTADGVVLAVLPSSVLPQSSDNPELVPRTHTDNPHTISVPLGWRRIVSGTSVLYISPSGTALSTLPQLRDYLQTAGTCKCGLPCPLRPETTFSFDPKVVSKPYQPASGAELTKLCNHKRKLLASLQARTHSPATPPPLLEHKKGTEAGTLKKKMKKRPGFPPNMSVSQLMVQRERPLNDFKVQENDPNRTISPGVRSSQNCMATFSPGPNAANDADVKQETPVQRGSHYLTVSSGWITQHDAPAGLGTPVLGTNGQLIGVNTGYNKQTNYKNSTTLHSHNLPDQEHKEDRRETPAPQNVQTLKRNVKEEESQIFCGLNQPLTPEVMQKINEQQQIFIQQNQKQIEMAMKGFRSQLAENINKPIVQSQYVPQGQLVIQNGAVVKTNPAKTPPWQVKRNDSNANPMTSPSPKLQNIDFDDSTSHSVSEDSSGSYNSFSNGEQSLNQSMNQAMCSRVPPLPQHYNMIGQQWPVADNNKKKPKAGNAKGGRKKASPIENKVVSFNSHGVRMIQEQKVNYEEASNNTLPSFMDDPSGYLAQQTVLLNNTISKQVGINATFDGNRFENTNNTFGQQCLGDRSCKSASKTCDMSNFRNNTVPNPSPSPSNTPDSSVLSDKSSEQSCKACNVSRGNAEFAENQVRHKYMRSNMYKMDHDGSATSSPRHGFEDNPVTSSTFDRSPPEPVQAGPVSTTDLPDAPPADRTPGATYSPYPPADRLTGTQVMHFISNHNVNKNLMEVDNISMVGVKPALQSPAEAFRSEQRRRLDSMPAYCPPPHLGGGPAHSLVQACYVQSFGSTVAGGCSVTRDTVTSVLAGRARTCTTSVNAASFVRPPPPEPAACAIPNTRPDPFIDSVNLPTSYPLHIAGTTAQNMICKSPLEIAQNVIGGAPSKPDAGGAQTMPANRRACTSNSGQILISSTGQIIVSGNQMPPPPPKAASSTSQVVSGVVSQSAVVVNALPTPFVLQPPVVAVDGQLVAGVVGHSPPDSARHVDVKHAQGFVQGVAMLSPESLKKRSKKKKTQTASVTNVLQIAAPQQTPSNIVVHSSPQHSASPQFSPRGFQLSPNNNISPTPVLQALTIVPGKSGTPAHIVMNGQGGAGGFGSQPLLANASPSQQINLLQPVNLINNASGVVPNFPAFQQFIVPNLGGVVMTADGGAIVQDGSGGMPVQLQLQTVNGQNVLTPVQSPGVFTGANGVVIRAQNQQGKIVQSQHSPGAQFLSPTGQVVVNGPNFNGQLSPLLANLSPTSVTFNTSPHQVRSGNVQTQEFIQTNQMGQTLMVPLSPKRASLASAANRGNSTFVQQNTTIVQQQTTLVSNSAGAPPELAPGSRIALDPELLLAKPSPSQERPDADGFAKFAADFGGMSAHVRHSVSTQTLVGPRAGPGPGAGAAAASSPPDTTTHSPLGALEASRSPLGARCRSTQAHYADTTTESPPPADNNSSAMVQCVSSSEPDVESRELGWSVPRPDFNADHDTQNLMSSLPLMRQNGTPSSAEATEMHYSRSMSSPAMSNQHMVPVSSDYFDRTQGYKRKNDFGDGSSYRTDKIMRTNNGMVHGMPKDVDFDSLGNDQNKSQQRHFSSSSGSDMSMKVFDRRNLGSGDDAKSGEEPAERRGGASFEVGDLVWGPVRGFASWPGCVAAAAAGGRLRVRWFGGGRAPPPPAALWPRALLSLSDGLEAHHAARTKHRKSRKLNTHLENAIQEAMAELDKKSERSRREQERGTGEEAVDATPIIDTPKRSKKHDKARKDGNHKKSKIPSSSTKVSDGSRLRSAR